MQKRIVAIAFALLMLVFMMVACNKNGDEGTSDYAPIEYTTDDDGNLYVTNVYGDLIPVTTGKDGSMELMEDLYTKTKEQVETDKAQQEKESTGGGDSATDHSEENSSSESQSSTEKNGNGIRVGTDSVTAEGNDAVIVW